MPTQLNIELWISIMSAIGAFASAVFAFRSNTVANRALKISQKEQETHDASVVPYLIEGVRRRQGKEEIIAFAVTYTNRSDLPNSLVKIELEINYSTKSGTIVNLLFPIADNASAVNELSSLPALRTPINLSARSTESGWLIFVVPLKSINGPIDKYRVIGLTATGDRVFMESFLLKTIFDADKKSPN